jgi:polyvinyl alcohol dehydrogenase (cytochrome)
MNTLQSVAVVAALSAWACIAHAQGTGSETRHPGEAVYYQWCASCHDNSDNTGAPSLQALRQLNEPTVRYALTDGYMRRQAARIPPAQLEQLIGYISDDAPDNDAWIANASCSASRRAVDLRAAPTVSWFGVDPLGYRRLTAEQAGLRTEQFADLELAWAIGFPQTPTMRSQPVIVGTTIFVAATDSARLYALDTASGCVKWVYKSTTPLRSSLSYGTLEPGKHLLVFGDAAGFVHALDAATGALVWKTDTKFDDQQRITGAPVIHEKRVYTPLSSIEVNYAPDDTYECCKSQGAVVALDLESGKQIWTARMMPPPVKQGRSRVGTQLWGPSGAPVWSTPVIDARRNVLYVGTGTNFSLPATDTSDALIAIDLDTGARRWVFQAATNDVWNGACSRKGSNCDFGSKSIVSDLDFGATPILGKLSNGSEALFAGHKSGSVWALDPNRRGAVIWHRSFGPGSPAGGIHWGLAFDGKRLFVPLNDPIGPGREHLHGPGLYALDADTGNVLWSFRATPDCGPHRSKRATNCNRRIGLSAAPLLIDGALVTGSTDGFLRIFEAATGKLLFQFDVIRDYETVNGVPGYGGGIDNAPFAAANGLLFVNAGYRRFGHPPGNVLLAFRPRSRN